MKIQFLNHLYDLDKSDNYTQLRELCEEIFNVYSPSCGIDKNRLGLYLHALNIYSNLLEQRDYREELARINRFKDQVIARYKPDYIKSAFEDFDQLFITKIDNDDLTKSIDINLYLNAHNNLSQSKSKLQQAKGLIGRIHEIDTVATVDDYSSKTEKGGELTDALDTFNSFLTDILKLPDDQIEEYIQDALGYSGDFFDYSDAVSALPSLLKDLLVSMRKTIKYMDIDHLRKKTCDLFLATYGTTRDFFDAFDVYDNMGVNIPSYLMPLFSVPYLLINSIKCCLQIRKINDIIDTGRVELSQNKKLSNAAKNLLIDFEERLSNRKQYVAFDAIISNITIIMAGAISVSSALFDPTGLSTLPVVTALRSFKNRYLLRQKIAHADQLEVLHDTLSEHVEKQINHLNQEIEKADTKGDSDKKEAAEKKLKSYLNAQNILNEYLSGGKSTIDDCLEEVIKASQIKRDQSQTYTNPKSLEDLKSVLTPFDGGVLGGGLDKNKYASTIKIIRDFEDKSSINNRISSSFAKLVAPSQPKQIMIPQQSLLNTQINAKPTMTVVRC